MSDLEAIKVQVSIEAFLDSLGGVYAPGNGRWTKYHCPFEGHANGDEHASGAVSPDGTYYRCRACGVRGDIFDLVQEAGLAKNLPEAVEWLQSNVLNQDPSTTDSS